MLSAKGCIDAATDTATFRQAQRERRRAGLPAAGLGRRPLPELCAGPCRRLLHGVPGRTGDGRAGSARDRADVLLRAAARVRNHADAADDPHGGCGEDQARHVPLLPEDRAPAWRGDPHRQAGAAVGAPALRDRPDAGVRAAEERARPFARARRLYGGRGDRSRPVRVLSLDRAEPEAALRADRGVPVRHLPARRRDLCRHGRPGRAERRHPHRRDRRGAVQVARHVRAVFQGRRRRPPRR